MLRIAKKINDIIFDFLIQASNLVEILSKTYICPVSKMKKQYGHHFPRRPPANAIICIVISNFEKAGLRGSS